MTFEETGIIMDILTTAYPRFYSGPDAPDRTKTLTLWAEMFIHDDVALVAAAVKALIETDAKDFRPISELSAKLRLITGGDELTEAEAWGMVAKAIRNSAYGSREEFEKLPSAIRRIVGSPSQLREWAQMDSETVHSVVASIFQRSYKVVAQREREIAKLLQRSRRLLGSWPMTGRWTPCQRKNGTAAKTGRYASPRPTGEIGSSDKPRYRAEPRGSACYAEGAEP